MLETQLHPKLQVARIQGRPCLAEALLVDTVVWTVGPSSRAGQQEVGVVKHVEALGAQLQTSLAQSVSHAL